MIMPSLPTLLACPSAHLFGNLSPSFCTIFCYQTFEPSVFRLNPRSFDGLLSNLLPARQAFVCRVLPMWKVLLNDGMEVEMLGASVRSHGGAESIIFLRCPGIVRWLKQETVR